jgi:bifunctional non-homologous end joining protein LigD
VPGAKKNAAPLAFVEPMKVLGVAAVPAGEWLLEVKFDGFRALAIIENGKAELWSRNEKNLSGDYPALAEALEHLPCDNAILDGEIVALDDAGRPAFQLLQNARQGGGRVPTLFYAFDLLHLDGRPLMTVPIEERKASLAALLADAPEKLRLSPVFKKDPAEFLADIKRRGFEGIVAKTPGSFYEPGRRSGAWLKCRVAHEQELVIGGYTAPAGARKFFGAILVGYYDGKRLIYAGKVGTGFDRRKLKELHAQFKRLQRADSPFARFSGSQRGVTWLKPELVAQIKFSEWTQDGLLRQPVFLGLRDDKAAEEVTREPLAANA